MLILAHFYLVVNIGQDCHYHCQETAESTTKERKYRCDQVAPAPFFRCHISNIRDGLRLWYIDCSGLWVGWVLVVWLRQLRILGIHRRFTGHFQSVVLVVKSKESKK